MLRPNAYSEIFNLVSCDDESFLVTIRTESWQVKEYAFHFSDKATAAERYFAPWKDTHGCTHAHCFTLSHTLHLSLIRYLPKPFRLLRSLPTASFFSFVFTLSATILLFS